MTKPNPVASCRHCGKQFIKPVKRSVFCSVVCSVMSKVERSDDGCWRWIGYIKANGYGSGSYNGKTIYPHRAMLEEKLGRSMLASEDTRHTCDNRTCCNPDHLLVGSRADNMRDCAERGRCRATLTVEDVFAIRSSDALGVDLARKMGVTPATISHVRLRQTWRHI